LVPTMSPNDTKWLRSQFPALYPEPRLHHSLSGDPLLGDDGNFECGDGWGTLLYRLSHAISTHACAVGLDVSVTLIKEKFGMLRVYVEGGDDEIDRLIDAAEAESGTICEVCGEPGTRDTKGWCTTRCDACRHRY
jgi:hypothetical protein